jgi:hypothetical protein
MVPVPAWPGLGPYPGSVLTTTIRTWFPESVLPDFVADVATTTPMYAGTPLTGGALAPPEVVQVPPHKVGGLDVGRTTLSAKPLNADGAELPERLLSFAHWAPHHVTFVVGPAEPTVRSPRTNTPRVGKAKTVAVLPVSADGR